MNDTTGVAPLLTIRPATHADLTTLWPVIERSYRGDASRAGWSSEADLLEGDRTDIATLAAIIDHSGTCLLLAERDDIPIGCVNIEDRGEGTAYLGLLCIEPTLQSGGLGRQMIAAAEETARTHFHATRMVMTVLEQREELIAYYMRRGYAPTGRRLDFPVPHDPPYFMTELAKSLQAPDVID